MKTTERNCAFQYGTMRGDIIHDESELTLDECKKLWNNYYSDCAKRISNGNGCQMYIWINMTDPNSYGETLWKIDNDAESDGRDIWVNVKTEFPKNL